MVVRCARCVRLLPPYHSSTLYRQQRDWCVYPLRAEDTAPGDVEAMELERRVDVPTTPAYQRLVEPVVLKHGNLFLLCTDAGDIVPRTDQGLYFHDMRHLSAATLRLNAEPCRVLLADAGDGHRSVHQLGINEQRLGLRREKVLGAAFVELITLENYTSDAVECALELEYAADFADMFVIRGLHPGRRGKVHSPRVSERTLTFRYDGADGHSRSTVLHLDHSPDHHRGARLTYKLKLPARQSWQLRITCEVRDRHSTSLESRPEASAGPSKEQRDRARAGQLDRQAQVETSNALFNAILGRSFVDLHMLRMRERDRVFFAAGVPWFVALFGRDTLITALEVLAFEPEIAANTLRVLASHQGTQVDDERDEQPGKIPHELRVDELANLGEIPQSAYYGSVDSTLLFLVLLGAHAAWTGSLDLFHELRPNACAALDWIDRFGDSDGDGFVDYKTRAKRGGRNQGWKDSFNAIVMQDGRLAEPPIALPEVQGDVYMAWQNMAPVFERAGEADYAMRLRQRAHDLRERFNRGFWLPDQRYLALCRQADGRYSASIASNGAHTLWTGIVAPHHARDVARRVMEDDMFNGWGVRTLSARDQSYNPIDYQVGSVWPHDNAIIVAGLQQCGFSTDANRVFTAIMSAAAAFPHFRLPEVFAGYPRELSSKPALYPFACNPQAWAAGSIPYMLSSMLGLRADGFNRRLNIVRPRLPEWLDWVTVRHLRVGGDEVDLRFDRTPHGTVVTPIRNSSDVTIEVEK